MVSHNIATSGAQQYNVEFKLSLFNRTTGNFERPSNAILLTKYGSSSTNGNMLCNFWLGAYDLVQQRDGDLMASYKNILETICAEIPPQADGDLLDPPYVEHLVKKLLEFRKNNEIKISFLNADTEMQEQIEKLARFLIWSNSMVDALATTHPHVALACSGATLFIQLHTKDAVYDDVLLKGYNIVGDIQVFWKTCGEFYLDPHSLESYENLEVELTKLYSLIIEYQARVLCHLTKPASLLSRSFQYFVGSNDWEAKIASIQELDQSCLNLISAQQQARIRRDGERQLQEIQISRHIQNKILHTIEEDIQDKKQQNLLHDLSNVSKDYARYKDINPERVQGTCEWFLTDKRFLKWRDSQSGELLWVSAGPGCGKSVLSKALIDEGLLNLKSTIAISPSTITKSEAVLCYFFFKEAGDGLMDSAHALCALLHQLFTCNSTSFLIKHALLSHKHHGQTLAQRTSNLWGILVECAKNSPVPIICVLDALDECKEGGKELVNLLRRLYSPIDRSSIPSQLKFLITSRPYDSLQFLFTKFASSIAYLHLDGDEKLGQISQEINTVIDFKMKEITKGFSVEDRDKIIYRLKSMENRTYLWLYLTFDIIEKNRSAHRRSVDIEEFLSTLPSEVADAYEKILSRSQNERMVEALLQIILVATRPLTLEETNCALALAIEEEMIPSYRNLKLWSQDDFKSTVTNLCGLFISIHDSKLSFIHQTAQEFLVSRDQARTGIWKGRLNLSESHGVLSSACINYLQILDTSCRYPKNFYPLFSYAISSWHLHFNLQDTKKTEMLRMPARKLCHKSDPQARFWVKEYHSRMIEASWTDLHLASHLGLAAVVYDIMKCEHVNVNAKGGSLDDQSTPLYIAIKQGHLAVVEILLKPAYKAEVKEDDIVCAANHKTNAVLMMSLLLETHGNEITITEWVLVNVVRNRECGAEVLLLLLCRRGDEVQISQWVAESAATQGSVKAMSLILDKCDYELLLTAEIQKGARQNGKDMKALLFKHAKFMAYQYYKGALETICSMLEAKRRCIIRAKLKSKARSNSDYESSDINSDNDSEIIGGETECTETGLVDSSYMTTVGRNSTSALSIASSSLNYEPSEPCSDHDSEEARDLRFLKRAIFLIERLMLCFHKNKICGRKMDQYLDNDFEQTRETESIGVERMDSIEETNALIGRLRGSNLITFPDSELDRIIFLLERVREGNRRLLCDLSHDEEEVE